MYSSLVLGWFHGLSDVMSEKEESDPFDVPAAILIIDPMDDNDQLITRLMIERISEEARVNINVSEAGLLRRIDLAINDMIELLNEEHLFLVLLCLAPEYRMRLPFVLGNFDMVLKDRLETLISRAVQVAIACKSNGFEIQRLTNENEDVERMIKSLIEAELKRVELGQSKDSSLDFEP